MNDTTKKQPNEAESKAVEKAREQATPIDWLYREFNRVLEDFGRTDWRLPMPTGGFGMDWKWPTRAGWKIAPAMDVVEKDDHYEVTAELPGMDEKNVEIKLSNGMLVISGEKTEEKEKKEKEYYMSERHFGSIRRAISVPAGVDEDKIEASFAKGVLTVKLPKSAEARKAEKKIEVKAA